MTALCDVPRQVVGAVERARGEVGGAVGRAALDDLLEAGRDEPEAVEDRAGGPGRGRRHRRDLVEDDQPAVEPDVGARQQLHLQLVRDRRVGVPELGARRPQHVHRLHRLAAELQRAREPDRGAGAVERAGRCAHRRPEVVGRLGAAAACGGARQLHQQRGVQLARRLGEGALQERDRRVRIAETGRPRGRVAQALDRPGVPARRDVEKLRADLLRRRAGLGQKLRRALMPLLPRPRRQVAGDRGQHDRVREPEPLAVAPQHVGPAQGLNGLVGGGRIEPREHRGDVGARALAEERDGPRHLGRPAGEPRHPGQHHRRDALGPERPHLARLLRGPGHALGGRLAHELADEEGVALGRGVAGGADASWASPATVARTQRGPPRRRAAPGAARARTRRSPAPAAPPPPARPAGACRSRPSAGAPPRAGPRSRGTRRSARPTTAHRRRRRASARPPRGWRRASTSRAAARTPPLPRAPGRSRPTSAA